MTRTFLKPVALVLALLGVFGLAACNTVAGVGEDLGAGGRVITDTARDVEEKL